MPERSDLHLSAHERQPETAERLLTVAEVCKMTAMHRATVYRHVAARKFPAPRQTGDNSVRWLLSEVVHWMRALPPAQIRPARKRESA